MRGSPQIRVLVVDDEADNAQLFESLLTKAGYAVTVVTDSTKVMGVLRKTDFQLVILDMMMPKLSGAEVLEKLRAFDNDLAVIVATAFPTVDTAVASLQAAASDYVRKPIDPPVFLETVRQALLKKGITRNADEELHLAVGRAIREGRIQQSLTLRQLSRRTGLSVSLLSQIERAESSASLSSLLRIASALRVRMSQLFADV